MIEEKTTTQVKGMVTEEQKAMAATTIQNRYRAWKVKKNQQMMLENLGRIDCDNNEIIEVQRKLSLAEHVESFGTIDFRQMPIDSNFYDHWLHRRYQNIPWLHAGLQAYS